MKFLNYAAGLILVPLSAFAATFIYVDPPPAGGPGPFADHSTLTTSLEAAYAFEEASGLPQDSHTTGPFHFDSVTSTPVYQQTGIHNYCLYYDDTTTQEYISETGGLVLPENTENFSFSCWVNIDSTSQTQTFLASATFQDFFLYYDPTNKWRFHFRNSADTANRQATYSSTPSTATWYHLVATYDHSNLKLFLDGVLRASTATTDNHRLGTTSTLQIGRLYNFTQALKGYVDEVYIWSKALSDGSPSVGNPATGEVAELYNLGAGLFYSSTPRPKVVASANTVNTNNKSTTVITLPAHQTNDILAIFWTSDDANSAGYTAPPSGYTEKNFTDSGNASHGVFYKRAASASEADPTLDAIHSGGGPAGTVVVIAAAIRNCITTGDPFDQFSATTGTDGTLASATITPTVDNGTAFFYGGHGNLGATWTTAPPPTAWYKDNDHSGSYPHYLNSRAAPTKNGTGITGITQSVSGTSDDHYEATFNLKPTS